MSIFEFSESRVYLRDYVARLPKEGRGELTRIAQRLGINTTLLSQIMSGSRDFTPEQALELSRYLGHTEIDTDYFGLLVQCERAGSATLKAHLKKKIAQTKTEALKLVRRISHDKRLSPAECSQFYSSWIYSAVHLFTSTKTNGVDINEICDRFKVSRARANQVIQFLIQAGLVTAAGDRYKISVQSTFLEKGSPDLLKHHANWRVHAINRADSLLDSELMFTGQASLSERDFARLRDLLAEFIKTTSQTAKDSEPENLACLNIDWYWI